ncbi:MAG: FkbM family methyltransferase [Planctomycetaceae bacterium]
MLWSWSQQAQLRLGVGCGTDTLGSGERAVVGMLANASASKPLCVVDVGANRGDYAEMVRTVLLGRSLAIHCFEPSHATYALLEQACGGIDGVTLNHSGLGRSDGQLTLYSDGDGSGLASLTKRNLDHFQIEFEQTETVRIRTLDGYCREHGIENIDLLKIDVEGHELDVLHGGKEMLSAGRVRLVQFEFGGCNIDTRTFVRDFWTFFNEVGMHAFYRIMPSGALFRIDAYSEDLEQFRTTNFLVECAPPSS